MVVTAVLYLTAGTISDITEAECLAYDHRLHADVLDPLCWLLAQFCFMGLLPSQFKPHFTKKIQEERFNCIFRVSQSGWLIPCGIWQHAKIQIKSEAFCPCFLFQAF